jgi:hypothetical protein
MGTDEGQRRQELTGTWYRSFEEETGGELVFRPPGFAFPPARAPRPALRLHADGTLAALRGGPGDQLEVVAGAEAGGGPGGETSGRWSAEDSTLTLQTPQLSGDFILEADAPGRLVLRPRPTPGRPADSPP